MARQENLSLLRNIQKEIVGSLNRVNSAVTILESSSTNNHNSQIEHLASIDTAVNAIDAKVSTEAKQDDVITNTGIVSGAVVAGKMRVDDDKISKGEDGTITGGGGGLQQVLLYGRDQTTDLHPVRITPQGDVNVELAEYPKGQELMADSLPVVISSDQSSITVSETFLRATQNINFTVNAGSNNTSTGVNMSPAGNPTYRQLVIFGETDNVTDFDMYVQFSNDNSNWYTGGYSEIIQLNVDPLDPSKSTFYKLIDSPPQWVRLLKLNSTLSTETLTVKTSRIN